MPEIVTRFTNDKKHLDKEKNRLKKIAFIPRDLSEISVVGIDIELKQNNADEIIFKIGDLIYKGPKFPHLENHFQLRLLCNKQRLP